jgi:hypothetical protein
MTNDAYTLAQVCLPELRVMASRHSYVHDGALRNFKVSIIQPGIYSPAQPSKWNCI